MRKSVPSQALVDTTFGPSDDGNGAVYEAGLVCSENQNQGLMRTRVRPSEAMGQVTDRYRFRP